MKNHKYRILIATYPFGRAGREPLDLLEQTGWQLLFNPFDRRLAADDVERLVSDVDAVIAGTEPYDRRIIQKAKKLKVISRVGVGLDGVDLDASKELGICVTFTPEAPSQAVAEVTIGFIINLCRHITKSDRSVREQAWNRFMGVLLEELTVGIVGVGRIGKKVCRLLQPFSPKILACDLKPDFAFGEKYFLTWVSKDELFANSDLVTLHIDYNDQNYQYVDRKTISKMKTGSYLINTSRGKVTDEKALTDALLQNHLGGAALDVFEKEPYEGILTQMDNVILTAHIGASARASRFLMELGAVKDCMRVLNGEKPEHDATVDVFRGEPCGKTAGYPNKEMNTFFHPVASHREFSS